MPENDCAFFVLLFILFLLNILYRKFPKLAYFWTDFGKIIDAEYDDGKESK